MGQLKYTLTDFQISGLKMIFTRSVGVEQGVKVKLRQEPTMSSFITESGVSIFVEIKGFTIWLAPNELLLYGNGVDYRFEQFSEDSDNDLLLSAFKKIDALVFTDT